KASLLVSRGDALETLVLDLPAGSAFRHRGQQTCALRVLACMALNFARTSPPSRHDIEVAGGRRLGVALSVSILAHICLFSMHPGGSVSRSPSLHALSVLSVRIAD